ncbi:MAG: tetratricopeptide repeat protein [Anaerolineae bacterium]|nr:tetratricopeptide repeat protein [Anaerolineae bacterium]
MPSETMDSTTTTPETAPQPAAIPSTAPPQAAGVDTTPVDVAAAETEAKHLRQLLNQQRPTTALALLGDDPRPEFGGYRVEALFQLDREEEAREYLEKLRPQVEGRERSLVDFLWAQTLLEDHKIDEAMLLYRAVAAREEDEGICARALAYLAEGHALKHCWESATRTLREALELAAVEMISVEPAHHHLSVLLAQARMRLVFDQRLPALAVYERLAKLPDPEAQFLANCGRGYVAYLLGEFEQSRALAETALAYSEETIAPLHALATVALSQDDAPALQAAIAEIEKRSPKAEALEPLKEELEKLNARLTPHPDLARRRLTAFPTTVQRRDHCGPSVIELVLRYWKGGLDLTNDQIATKVKDPQGGTPTYRMKEFFHLVGFDTVACTASIDQLKALIEAGYPTILEVEFSQSSHVTVVIGYDDVAGVIELQDPATHIITPIAYDELQKLRRTYFNSALIAFPMGQDHEKILARMDIFNDPVLAWVDQATLALDENRPHNVAELCERITQKYPDYNLAWTLWLQATLGLWRAAQERQSVQLSSLAARVKKEDGDEEADAARERFYAVLERAKAAHPDAKFAHWFTGLGASLDGDLDATLAAYQKAVEADGRDPRLLASLAENYYQMRNIEKAREFCTQALEIEPALVTANLWMARILRTTQPDVAEHYAQAAVELAPNWWLAHATLSEIDLALERYSDAFKEVNLAQAIAPNRPEAQSIKGRFLAMVGDYPASVMEIEAALNNDLPLTPDVVFECYQILCRIFFHAKAFDVAGEQAQAMLKHFPTEPWVLQFIAAAQAEAFIHKQADCTPEALAGMQERYEEGIAANEGAAWVVGDYLGYLAKLSDPQTAAEAAERLQSVYPDQGNLHFLRGSLLNEIGETEAAAQAMLQALARSDGVSDPDELYRAISVILEGLKEEAGVTAILETPVPENGAQMADRKRALGLVLSQQEESNKERARELLAEVIANDPDDAFAILHLGDIAATEAERESLYRRAVMLAPSWPNGRATLAYYLVKHERYDEALEITSGYEDSDIYILIQQARALSGLGHTEDAAVAWEKAIQISNEPDPWLYYQKWHAEEQSGWYDAALETARQCTELFPEAPQWYARAAEALSNMERYEEALATVEEGETHGLEARDVAWIAYEVARAKEDWITALEAVDQVIEADKEETASEGELGYWEGKRLVLLVQLGRIEEARQMAESLNLNAEGWGYAAWDLGPGNDAQLLALEFSERSLALDPDNFVGLNTLTQALGGLGREEELHAALERLRQAHPDQHNSYETMAYYAAVDGDLERALPLAERALTLGVFCWKAWATRGYIHFLLNHEQEALNDLETAWKRAGSERRARSHDFWWVLAILHKDDERAAYCREKAYEEAKTDFDRRMLAQVATIISG